MWDDFEPSPNPVLLDEVPSLDDDREARTNNPAAPVPASRKPDMKGKGRPDLGIVVFLHDMSVAARVCAEVLRCCACIETEAADIGCREPWR